MIALTLVATFDILHNEACHAWPPIIAADQLDGSVFTRMSRGESVMTRSDYISTQLGDVRDIKSSLVIY